MDVAEDLPDISAASSGTVYAAALVLTLRHGTPLGIVELPLHEHGLTAAELRTRLEAALPGLTNHGRHPGGTDDITIAPQVSLPKVTVVVPTNLKRPQQLIGCVSALARLEYPNFEVLVVDNRGAADEESAVLAEVSRAPGIRVVREVRPGISAARNAGVAAAEGEIVAFTDDDAIVDRRWLRALATRFATEPNLDCVTGLVMPKELETPAQVWYEQWANRVERSCAAVTFASASSGAASASRLRSDRFTVTSIGGASGHSRTFSLYATGSFGNGNNMAFRTQTLREIGGFDEALGTGTPTYGGEDLAIWVEMLFNGRRLGYEPRAIVYHTHRRTRAELEAQVYGYGVGFTAMLTAIVWRDPRHALGLFRSVPAGLRSLLRSTKKSPSPTDYPHELISAELAGRLRGPWAYVRSRRERRRVVGHRRQSCCIQTVH